MGVHDGHREKMRRRFLETGLDSFAEHEALELLLFYAIPRRDTNALAHKMMDHFGSLDAVLSAPVEELMRMDGIGENAAVLLKLVSRVVQKARLSASRETIVNSTEKAGDFLLERFRGEKNEVIYQLCLDRKGKLLSCRRLNEGGADSSELNIRRLVENALLVSASAVILAHNHPSGIALPSSEDYATTERVQAALSMVGVTLVDHIIVADDDFVSMADSGTLKHW
ncbi:MAG: DNA repair protein RadC [Ruminococcaceae bacterium]|nr:DNA repair protein RadC [Oscillospiraceae bacterium]